MGGLLVQETKIFGARFVCLCSPVCREGLLNILFLFLLLVLECCMSAICYYTVNLFLGGS